MSSEQFLSGSAAIVTGAGTGIGRATAAAVAAVGATVLLVGRRERLLGETREQLVAAGGSAEVFVADLAEERAAAEVVRRAQSLAPLAALVHAAGEVRPRRLVETSADDWRAQMATNLDAAFYLLRAALAPLGERQGAAVIVTSISGVSGPSKFAGFSAYAAAKGGANLLVEAAAPEFAQAGARVNALAPGSVDTEMLRRVAPNAKPAMTADEVASTILFLLSPASRPMNGRIVPCWGA